MGIICVKQKNVSDPDTTSENNLLSLAALCKLSSSVALLSQSNEKGFPPKSLAAEIQDLCNAFEKRSDQQQNPIVVCLAHQALAAFYTNQVSPPPPSHLI